MKNVVILLLFFGLFSCNTKNNNSSDVQEKSKNTTVRKNDSIKVSIKTELTELQKEERLRDSINDLYLKELSKCFQSVDAVTDFNEKKEFWSICEIDKNKRIIQINSHKDSALYEEVYFEQNGSLIYAEESIKYMPINSKVLQPWTCQFYTKNGKLLTIISLGHGKTEDENWNPEIIFEMYKKRLIELDKIKKE